MRSGRWVVLAVAFLGASAALAQDQSSQGQNRSARPGPGQGQDQGRPGSDQRPGPGSGPGNGGRPEAGRPNQPPQGGRPPATRPPPAPRPPHLAPRPPHRFMSGGRWRPGIHGPAFHYPPGFGYRRWSTGLILPPIFLASPYYYDGYAPLGLGPPPPGYRWVRYGPDLLLVNVATGRIADVVDGVFY
jgi:Ni/Co efflux regulator RcnB